MKKIVFALSLSAIGSLFTACNKQNETEILANQESATFVNNYQAPSFAEPDMSKPLSGSPAENLKTILETTGSKIITSLGRINITNEQYKEITNFTTDLVSGSKNQTEMYRKIFIWICNNVTYNHSNVNYSNDPYEVFKNKIAVCQGYANLLTVMCYSQGIPAVVINGLGWGMGHAWAYVCTDGVWEVSDPTNTGSFPMSALSQYTHLVPKEADVDLFADDYAVYRYNDYRINVDRVIAKNNPLVLPYSAGGFVISSFNPTEALPETITDIYVGANIETFGETYDMRLAISNYGKNLHAIYVDEANTKMLGHKGVVYRKNGDENQLYYIPGAMTYIEFLPMEKVDKMTVSNHQEVRVIYFPEGTKSFSASAIEKCPKLERVYIPEDATFPSNALYDCPKDVEVIRGSVPSSIKHVTM